MTDLPTNPLQNEAQFLNAIIDTVASLIIVLDAEGRIVRFNRACERLTGYTYAEVSGRVFWDFLLPPEDVQPVKEVFSGLRSGQFPNQHENDWVMKDGSRRRIAWSNTAILSPSGEAEYIVGTGMDITQLRTTRLALLESQKRYNALFHNHHTVMLLIDPQNGNIIEANPAAAEFYGYSIEQLQTMQITEINELPFDQVHAAMQRALSGPASHYQFQHRLSNGEIRDVDVFTGPITSADRPLLYSIIHDITERKQAEAMIENLARFPGENPHPVMRFSMDGLLLYGNRTSQPILDTWGCRPGEVIPPEWLEMVRAVSDSGNARETELEISGVIYSLTLQPVAQGGYVNIYGRDITEQRRLEKDLEKNIAALQTYASLLEQANREMQDFTFIASHDLKEPLRKIQGFGSRLATMLDLSNQPEASDYLARMTDASTRMQRMSNDLLAYSRIATHANPFVAVDLNAVARQAISDLELRIEQTGGQVQVSLLPVIEADEQQMQQLFTNLIGNALKYHKPNMPPVVRVYVGKKDTTENKETGKQVDPEHGSIRDPMLLSTPAAHPLPMITLCFEDNGIGFDPAQTERIFQPFQRLHTRAEYEGTGIGLSICRKIATRHGGSITAESTPGCGSTFIVSLPVRHNDLSQAHVG
jgi:PAS domain S-box-containing protein